MKSGEYQWVVVVLSIVACLAWIAAKPPKPKMPEFKKVEHPKERPTEASTFRFDPRRKEGLSIWGVQPGDDVGELLGGLTPDIQVKFEELDLAAPGRKLILRGPDGQLLNVFTRKSEKSELVDRIGIVPVNNDFSLELSGEALLYGKATAIEVQKRFGYQDRQARYSSVRGGIEVHFELLEGRLFASGLRKVADSPRN